MLEMTVNLIGTTGNIVFDFGTPLTYMTKILKY